MTKEQGASKNTIIAGVAGAGVVALLIAAVLFGGSLGETAVPIEEANTFFDGVTTSHAIIVVLYRLFI